jgi:hypothetical protein
MKRWALGLALVLAVAAGGLYWLYTSLDFVVKSAIERFGPDMVGATVSVREVSLSATDGRGTLRGVEIGNPPGFAAARSVRVGTITFGIEPASLGRDVVVIRDILVEAPEITYEVRGGTNNLEAIERNIEAYVKRSGGGAAGKGEAAGRAGGRRYIIGRVTLRGARVTMTNALLKGGGIAFDLPDVDLRDIGKREAGVSAQRVLTSVDLLRRGGTQGALDALRGLLR